MDKTMSILVAAVGAVLTAMGASLYSFLSSQIVVATDLEPVERGIERIERKVDGNVDSVKSLVRHQQLGRIEYLRDQVRGLDSAMYDRKLTASESTRLLRYQDDLKRAEQELRSTF